ncbi:MAG: trypsin-like peptidase domain-containing protein [Thermodesulfovibrionia bacterium]|nr:trypsin-like peptidase domain-containing protein [Thermodesulfovibrionia bacterium]
MSRHDVKIKNILIFIICLLLFPHTSLADAGKIFKDNNDAVIVVKTYDKKNNPLGQGSGFIISKNGAIVTNHHVIEGAYSIYVKIDNKAVKVEDIISDDKENDLAVLKIRAGNYPVVTLGSIDNIAIGEKIYVIGSPQGLENTISDGILSGIREMGPGKRVLQITAPISQGSSGGPVFNEEGRVVGVVTFLLMKSQNLNFAMPIDLVSYSSGTKKSLDVSVRKPDETATKKIEYPASSYENSSMKITTSGDINKKAPAEEAEHWYKLGLSYGKTNMRKEEINSYKKAVKLNPEHAMAHYNLGLAYSDLGIYDESIKALEEAVKLRPKYAEAIYNLGLTYLTVNNKEASLRQYNKLKEIDPKLSEKLMGQIKSQSH